MPESESESDSESESKSESKLFAAICVSRHCTYDIVHHRQDKGQEEWAASGRRGRVCDVGCVYARCVLELDGTWQTYILRPAAAVEIKFPARTLRNQIHQRGAVKWGRGMRGEICQKV